MLDSLSAGGRVAGSCPPSPRRPSSAVIDVWLEIERRGDESRRGARAAAALARGRAADRARRRARAPPERRRGRAGPVRRPRPVAAPLPRAGRARAAGRATSAATPPRRSPRCDEHLDGARDDDADESVRTIAALLDWRTPATRRCSTRATNGPQQADPTGAEAFPLAAEAVLLEPPHRRTRRRRRGRGRALGRTPRASTSPTEDAEGLGALASRAGRLDMAGEWDEAAASTARSSRRATSRGRRGAAAGAARGPAAAHARSARPRGRGAGDVLPTRRRAT